MPGPGDAEMGTVSTLTKLLTALADGGTCQQVSHRSQHRDRVYGEGSEGECGVTLRSGLKATPTPGPVLFLRPGKGIYSYGLSIVLRCWTGHDDLS